MTKTLRRITTSRHQRPKKLQLFCIFLAALMGFTSLCVFATLTKNLLLPRVGTTLFDAASTKTIYKKNTNGRPSSGVLLLFPPSLQQLYKYQASIPREYADSNPEICGTGPDYEAFFAQHFRERSSSNEDKTIYSIFFKHINDRSQHASMKYVELGAFNGKEESNSRFFDECLGWQGMLVEPNPLVYEDLLENRPHAHRLSFAATCSGTNDTNNKNYEHVGFWASPFTNSAQDASVNRKAYAEHPQSEMIQVPCGSLTGPILELLGPRIHFFSLDVEGMEPVVLEHLDLKRMFVDVFMVESDNYFCRGRCKTRKQTRALLRNQYGYYLFRNVVDKSDIFVHPKSPYLSFIKNVMPVDETDLQKQGKLLLERDVRCTRPDAHKRLLINLDLMGFN